MASRYWVKTAGGTWDASDTSNWSASSGGASGASVPSSVDDVFFDANSGANTITYNIVKTIGSFNCTGFTGTLTGSGTFVIKASTVLVAGMTLSGTLVWRTNNTSNANFTSGGKSLYHFRADPSLVTLTLQDALTTEIFTKTNSGTFDADTHNITITDYFTMSSGTLTMGSGTWDLSGTGSVWIMTGGAVTPETSTIKLTNNSSSAKTFTGDGETYNDLWVATSGTGTTTIEGSNTFADLKANAGRTLYLEAGETQTCSTITMTGTTGSHITLQSDSSGVTAALAVTTPTIERVDVKDIVASVGTFNNASGFDDGNNTGIRFLFKDPANMYASDNTYATCDADSGVIGIRISKDDGSNWSAWKTKTYTGSEVVQTFGSSTDNWGIALVGSDLDDGNLKVQVQCGSELLTFSNYKTFGFAVTASNIINGLEINMEAKWDGSLTSMDHLEVKSYSGTSEITVVAGAQAYASDGRKAGEGVGAGTGVLAFYDGTNWIAVDTGATVAA